MAETKQTHLEFAAKVVAAQFKKRSAEFLQAAATQEAGLSKILTTLAVQDLEVVELLETALEADRNARGEA